MTNLIRKIWHEGWDIADQEINVNKKISAIASAIRHLVRRQIYTYHYNRQTWFET